MTSVEKWNEWNRKVAKEMRNPYIRRGQAFMNALADVDLPLYDRITNTSADCYYDDKRCSLFMDMLMKEW